MTTRPNETTRPSTFDCDHNPQGSQPEDIQTTRPTEYLFTWVVVGIVIISFVSIYAGYMASDISEEGYTLEYTCAVLWILIQMVKLCLAGILICGMVMLICRVGQYFKKTE